jgi:hypothetical protein
VEDGFNMDDPAWGVSLGGFSWGLPLGEGPHHWGPNDFSTLSNAIGLAPAEDFRRDSDPFGEGARSPEAQGLFQAVLKRGFQTRDAEMDLARMLGDLAEN